MQKGTSGNHYKVSEERKTEGMYIRLTASEARKIKEKAAQAGVSVSTYLIESALRRRLPKAQNQATKTPQKTAKTAAPRQALSSQNQTSPATGDKQCPPQAKAKRGRKTASDGDAAKHAPKSSRVTSRRKTTTSRASASRRQVVPEKDRAS